MISMGDLFRTYRGQPLGSFGKIICGVRIFVDDPYQRKKEGFNAGVVFIS
jgi:hypothetical protein